MGIGIIHTTLEYENEFYKAGDKIKLVKSGFKQKVVEGYLMDTAEVELEIINATILKITSIIDCYGVDKYPIQITYKDNKCQYNGGYFNVGQRNYTFTKVKEDENG